MMKSSLTEDISKTMSSMTLSSNDDTSKVDNKTEDNDKSVKISSEEYSSEANISSMSTSSKPSENCSDKDSSKTNDQDQEIPKETDDSLPMSSESSEKSSSEKPTADAPKKPSSDKESVHPKSKSVPSNASNTGSNNTLASLGRPGTTKRRQYYFKQVAESLAEKQSKTFCLYAFKMRLTCALPDEQNTRGRKIHPPEKADHSFGILVQKGMPPICQFPIYTRDGEIFVDTSLVDENLVLNEEETEVVQTFHKYTFAQVLRLEKYPMVYRPNEANSNVFVVPLSNAKGNFN